MLHGAFLILLAVGGLCLALVIVEGLYRIAYRHIKGFRRQVDAFFSSLER